MILYPFQPDLPFGYSVTGFDEEKKTPGAELYLLPPGAQIPAEFTGARDLQRSAGLRRRTHPAARAVGRAGRGRGLGGHAGVGRVAGGVRPDAAGTVGRAAVDVPAAALHALPGPLPHRRRRSSGPG